MSQDLKNYRKSYEKGILDKATMAENPIEQFGIWFKEAESSGSVEEINAMTLCTWGTDGFPRGRVVLLKAFDGDGFLFYTNYNSEKGKAIKQNNKVSISFFWPALQQQILIKGTVTKTSDENSEAYFKMRPRGSQLGALVSDQSNVIEDREILEEKLKTLEKRYEGMEVPKPKDWGGYVIKPMEFEFWQGRRNRLHDRIRYNLVNGKWNKERLQP